ncbi:MAG: hypothetical protein NC926_10105 [Candidatus Omnitrophica bacterium]|nr:hypothetical protein [Candidatus Omnitrophota bacterium]
MNKKIKVSVQIKLVKDPEGKEKLKATIPINIMFDKEFDAKILEEELIKFERRYFYLIICLKSLLESIHSMKQKDGKVLLYWEIGDKIISFIKNNENTPFFMENITSSLVRDVGISKKFLTRCKRFRVNYPDVTQIDPTKSFWGYVATFEKGYLSKGRYTKIKNNEKTKK